MGSYLLRLVERERLDGRVVGTAELLDSGGVVTIHSADELIALLLAEGPREASPRGRAPT